MLKALVRLLNWLKDNWEIKRDPVAYARRIGVTIGANCKLGAIDRGTFGTEPYLVSIGRHVEITLGVRFITHDGAVWVFRHERPGLDVIAPISIGDNVFIGMNSLLLAGTTIGNNVVVAAGAVVTGRIPDNSVVGGVPAKFICSLDDFRARALSKSLDIRTMPPAAKEAFLREHFAAKPSEQGESTGH